MSLMELLIVVSIIAVLGALLIPAVRQARERTKTMTCMNKLRQAGSAAMLYAAEHGHLPHSSHFEYWADWGESLIPYMVFMNGNPVYVPGESWAYGLYKIQGTFQHLDHQVSQGQKDGSGNVIWPGYDFFSCPAAPQPPPTQHIHGHNYACNEYLMPNNNWRNWLPGSPTYANGADTLAGGSVIFPPVRPSELKRPGSLILICDSGASDAADGATGALLRESLDSLPNAINDIVNDFVNNPSDASTRGGLPVTTPATGDNDDGPGAGWPVYYRHNGKCVALMADGHVQLFANGEMQRQNFVSKARTKRWGGGPSGFVEAEYP
jgi:prepilin-type processing-associated H-X9-DG protein